MIILFLYIGNDYKGQMLAPGLSCCLFLSRTGKRARTATKTSGDNQDHGKDKRKLFPEKTKLPVYIQKQAVGNGRDFCFVLKQGFPVSLS